MQISSRTNPKNQILHDLFDKFMEMMSPVLQKSTQEKWHQFHALLQESPINYYNIQAFLIHFDPQKSEDPSEKSSSQESQELESEESKSDSSKETEEDNSLEQQSLQSPIPQNLLEQTTELLDYFNKNTDKLNKLFSKRSNTPTKKKVRHQIPQPISRNATYFQTFSHNNYPIYNPRQGSTYQPSYIPATVQNQQQQQFQKLPFQQQSFHSQQHSFQYFSNQYMENGMFKTVANNNGTSLNNLFY